MITLLSASVEHGGGAQPRTPERRAQPGAQVLVKKLAESKQKEQKQTKTTKTYINK